MVTKEVNLQRESLRRLSRPWSGCLETSTTASCRPSCSRHFQTSKGCYSPPVASHNRRLSHTRPRNEKRVNIYNPHTRELLVLTQVVSILREVEQNALEELVLRIERRHDWYQVALGYRVVEERQSPLPLVVQPLMQTHEVSVPLPHDKQHSPSSIRSDQSTIVFSALDFTQHTIDGSLPRRAVIIIVTGVATIACCCCTLSGASILGSHSQRLSSFGQTSSLSSVVVVSTVVVVGCCCCCWLFESFLSFSFWFFFPPVF